MKVQVLNVNVDSKLVACQMNGEFMASSEGMAKYLAKAKEQATLSLRMKISQYVMEDGVLFKKSYLSLMLRCVGPLQANYRIREVHEGACGMDARARSVVAKIMRQGYYWPSMHDDTKEVIDKCDSYQIHAPMPKLPKTHLTSIMSPWSFYQWGLDILGPLPEGPGKLKFIIVVIDYFIKWIEVKPLAKTTGRRSKEFYVAEYCMQVWSPEGRERVGWVDELPNILWAHHTMLKTSNGETPFSLTYGSEAVILAEIGMPTYCTIYFNESQNEEEMRLNLDLLQERRETAAIREAKYNKKVE
ncbi:reverse transcriptase domain-containing protein [Tanacetum coccineum]